MNLDNEIWRNLGHKITKFEEYLGKIHRNRSLKKARKAKRRNSTWYTGGGKRSEKIFK